MQDLGSRSLVLLSLALVATLPVTAAPVPPGGGTCQFVHVVDPCQDDLLIFQVGEPYIRHNVPLDQSYIFGFDATGVAFATVPDYAGTTSFVTQGPFLRVVDHGLASPRRTIDVELGFDIAAIRLNKVDAAPPVAIDGVVEYPLYLVGTRMLGWTTEPYFVVLDQAALLQGETAPEAILLGAGPLCVEGVSCRGVGLDIAASAASAGGAIQEAFAAVVDVEGDGTRRQRFFRIRRTAAAWTVSLDPWNDEGVPFSGAAHRTLGVDYDSTGLLPFGAFQTTATVADLLDGERSCALPGDPTDLRVWGPGAGVEQPSFHFVTSENGTTDLLLAFPDGGCVDGGAASLALPVGAHPRALALGSDTANDLWVYTGNRDHGISAVQVRLEHVDDEDRITVLQQLDIPFAGCPSDLAFRAESFTRCDSFPDQPHPAEPSPPDPECIDPLDPACIDPDDECPPEGCELRVPSRR